MVGDPLLSTHYTCVRPDPLYKDERAKWQVVDFAIFQVLLCAIQEMEQNTFVNGGLYNELHCCTWFEASAGVLISPLSDPEGNKLQWPNSNFCKPLKNNSEGCPSNQVSAAAMTSTSDGELRHFNCFFSWVGLRTYRHPCRWHLRSFGWSNWIEQYLGSSPSRPDALWPKDRPFVPHVLY